MLNKSSIKIYARVKPSAEALNYYDVMLQDGKSESLVIHTTSKQKRDSNSTSHSFKFQKVFTENAEQKTLHDIVAQPVVKAVFSGYNGAILAYGQTGTGKTHSIFGGMTASSRGMIPRAFQQILDMIAADQANNSPREFTVSMSTLEIYNELCIDLLSKDSLGNEEKFRVGLREDAAGNVRLSNLKEYPVRNMQEVEKYLLQSITNRITADTPMNQHSSRSHCIFTLYLRQRVNGEKKQVKSKLHMIDLSGSERVWKNRTSSHQMSEAKHINLSLHYLEQVIIALNDPKRSHVPYRNSSITNFLRDSLGGNSRTAMVFTISLEPNNFYETLSTCRFSQRVSLVKNHTSKVIEYDKEEELDFLRLEVDRLKRIISEVIGEDQMRIKTSISEESQLPKSADVIKRMKYTAGRTKEQLNLKSISERTFEEDNRMEATNLEEPAIQPGLEKTLAPKPLDLKDASSQTTAHSECTPEAENESDAESRCLKIGTKTSNYLDDVYNILADEDLTKSELLNVGKLLTVIGLDLPYADRRTGHRFAEKDHDEFKVYLEMPQNREVLKVYVRLSIIFQKHVVDEQRLLKRAKTIHNGLKKVTLKLKSSGDRDGSADKSQELKHVKSKLDNEYQNCFKSIMKKMKKERFHYLKLFNQTKLLLADAFQDWKLKIEAQKREETMKLDQEKKRLEDWACSMRYPQEYSSYNDVKKAESPRPFTERKRECERLSSDSTALMENVKRLETWAWNMRHRPCKIPEPEVPVVKSFSSINMRKEDANCHSNRTSSAV